LSKMGNYDVVYSCSDYFCDVIPAVLYKKKYKKKYISMIHHLSKPPRERKGNYLINSISYYFQKISHLIIKKYSDLIFLYDTDEGRLIAKNFPNNKIKYVANGIDFDLINSIYVEERKKYDACFVGGLRASKGVFDAIEIWRNVVKTLPKAKLVMIGEGNDQVTGEIIERIEKLDLNKNILLLGQMNKKDLISSMKSSKIFISPSREEGWGISVCEALACNLLAITYDLPAYNNFQEGLIKVKIGDNKEFSNIVIKLIEKNEYKNNFEGIKKFDWKIISNADISAINEII